MKEFTKPFGEVADAKEAALRLGCSENKVKLAVVIENNRIINLAWMRNKNHYILVLDQQPVGDNAKFVPFDGEHQIEPYRIVQGHFCYYDGKNKTLNEISIITTRKLASERAYLSGVFDDAPVVGKIYLETGKHKGKYVYVWFARQDMGNKSELIPVFPDEEEYVPKNKETLKLLREGQEVISLDGNTSLHMIYMIPTGCRLI